MPSRVVPEHPCVICKKPTTNRLVCSRACSARYIRRLSPRSKPGKRPESRISVYERFFRFVPDRPEDECWPWVGACDTEGYGSIWDSESHRRLPAHRVSWEIHKGPIPEGYVVSPVCETRSCSNPKHLKCGPRGEIIAQRLRLNRKTATYGDNNASSQLTDEEVEHIRRLHTERRFDDIAAIAEEKGMSRNYVIAVGRSRGRIRKARTAEVRTRYQ